MMKNGPDEEELRNLYAAVLLLNDVEECRQFFDDLCTVAELSAIGQRFKVAQLLRAGHTCQKIAEQTGASTATISRVNRCLHHGSGGYRLVLEREEARGNE